MSEKIENKRCDGSGPSDRRVSATDPMVGGPSFMRRAMCERSRFIRKDVPMSQQMDDIERLIGIASSMAGSDAELLSLIHRAAVYADMDINYCGDGIRWSKAFSDASSAYSYEYMEVLRSICDGTGNILTGSGEE